MRSIRWVSISIFLMALMTGWVSGQEGLTPQESVCRLQQTNLVAPQTDAFVGGSIWQEANSNGLRDIGEIPVTNIPVSISLYWGVNGLVTDNQPTGCVAFPDANGNFRFRVLPPPAGAQFFLAVDVDALLESEPGYILAELNTFDDNGSDFIPDLGQTASFTLLRATPQNTVDLEYDLGLIKIPQCDNFMNVVLALDFVYFISGESNRFTAIKYLARGIVRGLNVNPGGTHVSTVQFSRTNSVGEINSRVDIQLGQYVNRNLLMQAIRGITVSNPLKNTSRSVWEGLYLSDQQLDNFPRPPLPNIIIMITDGEHTETNLGYGSKHKEDPRPLANAIKKEGTLIFVVRLRPREDRNGNIKAITDGYMLGYPNKNQQGVASWPLDTYVINVRGQDSLTTALVPLLTNLCDATQLDAPIRNYYTTSILTLNWTPYADVTGYEVQIAGTPNFNTAIVFGEVVVAETITTMPLTDGIYWWRVRPIFPNGVGAWNLIDSFVIDAVP